MKRKILLSVFTLVTLSACAFGLSACDEKEHTHSYTSEVTTAATCTTAGKESDTLCSVCGETLSKGKKISVLDHSYDDGVCTVCGKKQYSKDLHIYDFPINSNRRFLSRLESKILCPSIPCERLPQSQEK